MSECIRLLPAVAQLVEHPKRDLGSWVGVPGAMAVVSDQELGVFYEKCVIHLDCETEKQNLAAAGLFG